MANGLLGGMDQLRGILASPSTNDFALALLANSGYNSRRRGLGEIIGTSMLQSRAMAAEAAQQKLREQYMQAQIAAMQAKPQAEVRSPFSAVDPSKFTRESVARFQQTGDYSVLEPIAAETGDAGPKIGQYNPGDYTPDSFAKFLESRDPRDLRRQYAPQAAPAPWIGMIGGGVGVMTRNRDGSVGPVQQITTGAEERDAAAQRTAAERRAAELAAAQAKRDADFENDMSVIDDEIERTVRLKGEFERGVYQTGPLAGKLPAFRTAAQNLRREQGKDVIRNIGSATFGALSEGERGFLKDLGVSEDASEESNIAYLEEREKVLRRARDRLRNRKPLVSPQGEATPPQGSYTHPSGAIVNILPPAGR